MTAEEAYIRYLDLVNRNATNNGVNVDAPRFVLLYNDMQRRYVEWVLEKRNEDEIRYLQLLLVNEHSLVVKDNRKEYTSFSLPKNYFDFSNVAAKAKTDCCPERKMLLFEIKSEDREELLADENNKPSFEFAETFYYFSSDTITIYKDNFDIVGVKMTYYRYPTEINLAGYIGLDNNPSTTIHPEFDDKVVNRILVAMAKEFSAINSEANEYQLGKDRLFTKI